MKTIGAVDRLCRYPVKSMQGEAIDEAFVAFTGVAGDRVHAFVDPTARPDFPWLTARELPELVRWRPRYLDPPALADRYPPAERLRVEVEDPDGRRFAIDDPTLIEDIRARSGRTVALRSSEKGMHDARPVSLIAHASIDAIAAQVGAPLDPARFRANLYVRWLSGRAFEEDALVGRTLLVGDTVELMVRKRDGRCAIVNVDPVTAARDPAVLKAIGASRQAQLGVYCVVLREGIVRRGDAIALADRDG